MSGGFFRGTSADQDTRFSNKTSKLMKSQKFPPELDEPVDMSKVNMDVIKPWIARRITEILNGLEDDILISLIYTLLEKGEHPKKIQIDLTGFLEKNTSKFMKELWSLLISAQKNVSGIPQQFIDEKAEESRRKKETDERMNVQLQKIREIHEQEEEQNRKLSADVEAAKKAAAEAAARLSAQLLQQDRKNGVLSTDPAPEGVEASAEKPSEGGNGQKAGDDIRRKSSRSRSAASSDRSRSRSRSRSLSRSPGPGRRSSSPAQRRQSRSPPRKRSPPPMGRRPSRSYSRSPSRGPPRRYRRSPARPGRSPQGRGYGRSPPRNYDHSPPPRSYYNGRGGPSYDGRRDRDRDYDRDHRGRGSDRYNRPISDRDRQSERRPDRRDSYQDRPSDRRSAYAERDGERRLGPDGRGSGYDDRRVAGEKRSFREVEEARRRPISPDLKKPDRKEESSESSEEEGPRPARRPVASSPAKEDLSPEPVRKRGTYPDKEDVLPRESKEPLQRRAPYPNNEDRSLRGPIRKRGAYPEDEDLSPRGPVRKRPAHPEEGNRLPRDTSGKKATYAGEEDLLPRAPIRTRAPYPEAEDRPPRGLAQKRVPRPDEGSLSGSRSRSRSGESESEEEPSRQGRVMRAVVDRRMNARKDEMDEGDGRLEKGRGGEDRKQREDVDRKPMVTAKEEVRGRGEGSRQAERSAKDGRMKAEARGKVAPVEVKVEEDSEEEMEPVKGKKKETRSEMEVKETKGLKDDDGDESPEDSEERAELKRKRKEEKKARKEEKRKRKEEKRKRKEEKRAAKEAKRLQTGREAGSDSAREESGRDEYDEDELPEERQKRLEDVLRKKALESLRAKKTGAS